MTHECEEFGRYLLLAIGMVVLVFGFFVAANYVFKMNGDREWGANVLLYDLDLLLSEFHSNCLDWG